MNPPPTLPPRDGSAVRYSLHAPREHPPPPPPRGCRNLSSSLRAIPRRRRSPLPDQRPRCRSSSLRTSSRVPARCRTPPQPALAGAVVVPPSAGLAPRTAPEEAKVVPRRRRRTPLRPTPIATEVVSPFLRSLARDCPPRRRGGMPFL